MSYTISHFMGQSTTGQQHSIAPSTTYSPWEGHAWEQRQRPCMDITASTILCFLYLCCSNTCIQCCLRVQLEQNPCALMCAIVYKAVELCIPLYIRKYPGAIPCTFSHECTHSHIFEKLTVCAVYGHVSRVYTHRYQIVRFTIGQGCLLNKSHIQAREARGSIASVFISVGR